MGAWAARTVERLRRHEQGHTDTIKALTDDPGLRDRLSGKRIWELDLNDARIPVHRTALTRFGAARSRRPARLIMNVTCSWGARVRQVGCRRAPR